VSILNLRLLGHVRVKLLKLLGQLGVIGDQQDDSFKLLFVLLLPHCV